VTRRQKAVMAALDEMHKLFPTQTYFDMSQLSWVAAKYDTSIHDHSRSLGAYALSNQKDPTFRWWLPVKSTLEALERKGKVRRVSTGGKLPAWGKAYAVPSQGRGAVAA